MFKKEDIEDKDYRTSEVAALLGVSGKTVRRYMDSGDMVYYTLPSGHRRVTRGELINYLMGAGLLKSGAAKIDAAYIRVSPNFGRQKLRLARQRRAVDDMAARHAPRDLTWFEDTADGTTEYRPGLAALMAEVRAGRIDRIFVQRRDRLSVLGFDAIERECENRGTVIKELSDKYLEDAQKEEMARDVMAALEQAGIYSLVSRMMTGRLDAEAQAIADEKARRQREFEEERERFLAERSAKRYNAAQAYVDRVHNRSKLTPEEQRRRIEELERTPGTYEFGAERERAKETIRRMTAELERAIKNEERQAARLLEYKRTEAERVLSTEHQEEQNSHFDEIRRKIQELQDREDAIIRAAKQSHPDVKVD